MTKISYLAIVFLFLVGLLGSGCSTRSAEKPYELTAAADLPEEVRTAPASVRQAYQFAAANPEVLRNVPCYCGCGAMEHTSNYDCYIKDGSNPGSLVFDGHALGCSICVDITEDVMNMLDQGLSLNEIRAEIDTVYSAYGPSNMP